MRKKFGFLVLLYGLSGLAVVVHAADEYELYSWQDGNDWKYSLLPASKDERLATEIKQSAKPLRGSGQVKEKILNLKEGDKISWQERADSGLSYPPPLVMEDIGDYAHSVGVKVVAPR